MLLFLYKRKSAGERGENGKMVINHKLQRNPFHRSTGIQKAKMGLGARYSWVDKFPGTKSRDPATEWLKLLQSQRNLIKEKKKNLQTHN